MPLWVLSPVTHPSDPRWQGRTIFSKVVIRAGTAGEARRLASQYELPVGQDAPAAAVGNGAEPLMSALEDEKLYRMDRVAEDEGAFLDRLGPDVQAAGTGSGVLLAEQAGPAPL